MGLITKDKEKATSKEEVAKSKEASPQKRHYLPETNIFEGDNKFVLELNIPGARKEDVNVNIENQFLSVEAKVSSDSYLDKKSLYREYQVGHFYRQFKITDSVEIEAIKAEVKNGMLSLTLPKKEKMQPKRIKIQ